MIPGRNNDSQLSSAASRTAGKNWGNLAKLGKLGNLLGEKREAAGCKNSAHC
ncbi:hypothetical protein HTZ85_05620 [Escherichia coli]|nr:hypothetical protein [Escherichia coli]